MSFIIHSCADLNPHCNTIHKAWAAVDVEEVVVALLLMLLLVERKKNRDRDLNSRLHTKKMQGQYSYYNTHSVGHKICQGFNSLTIYKHSYADAQSRVVNIVGLEIQRNLRVINLDIKIIFEDFLFYKIINKNIDLIFLIIIKYFFEGNLIQYVVPLYFR